MYTASEVPPMTFYYNSGKQGAQPTRVMAISVCKLLALGRAPYLYMICPLMTNLYCNVIKTRTRGTNSIVLYKVQ